MYVYVYVSCNQPVSLPIADIPILKEGNECALIEIRNLMENRRWIYTQLIQTTHSIEIHIANLLRYNAKGTLPLNVCV